MSKRNSNLELLRIVCIAMIISFHYVHKGDFSDWAQNNLTNKILIDAINYLGELAVNCFILISGYFFENTNFKWKKIILILLQCWFYIFLALFVLDVFELGSNWSIKEFIFPIMRNKFWFITVYVFIYILSPYIKKLLKVITEHELRIFIIIQLFIWSVYPTIVCWLKGNSSPESLPYYNRLIWLIVVYIIGAYIKMYNPFIISSLKRSVVLFAITVCCTLGYIFICDLNLFPINQVATYFWTPNSIIELLLSLGLFGIFKNIDISNSKIINYVASCTLGIYMLHDGGLVNFWWDYVFKNSSYQYSDSLWAQIVFATLTLMILGVVVESIRKVIEHIIDKYLISRFVKE